MVYVNYILVYVNYILGAFDIRRTNQTPRLIDYYKLLAVYL